MTWQAIVFSVTLLLSILVFYRLASGVTYNPRAGFWDGLLFRIEDCIDDLRVRMVAGVVMVGGVIESVADRRFALAMFCLIFGSLMLASAWHGIGNRINSSLIQRGSASHKMRVFGGFALVVVLMLLSGCSTTYTNAPPPDNLFSFMDMNPWQTFFLGVYGLIVAVLLLGIVRYLIGRPLAAVTIWLRGYPPAHCNAGGLPVEKPKINPDLS